MHIKYDEYDLLELFLDEPFDPVDEWDAGFRNYTAKEGEFKLLLSFSTYEQTCNVCITFKDLNVFCCHLENVTSFEKNGKFLIISTKNKPKLKLKFEKQLGAEIINN